MAKIKEVKASPNHSSFWNERSSLFLTKVITLVKMSNVKNVDYQDLTLITLDQ